MPLLGADAMVRSVVLHGARGDRSRQGVLLVGCGLWRSNIGWFVGGRRAAQSSNEVIELALVDTNLAAEVDGGESAVFDEPTDMAVRGGQQPCDFVACEE